MLVGSLLAVAGAFLGSGALGGTPVDEAAGGALAADATHVAPGGPAFSIWSVIYTGLVAYAIWQVLPAQRADARQRATGWLALASLVLNAAWIGTVQADALGVGVAVIVALLVVLAVIHVRLVRSRAAGRVEAVVVDTTFGLYFGWVTIATVADVAATLAASGVDELGLGPDAWAVVVLVVAAAIGVGVAVHAARVSHARVSAAAALAWGLAWIAIARSTGEPASTPAAVAAAGAAVVVLGTAVVLRVRGLRGPAQR